MRLVQRIFDFYLDASIHVAFVALAFVNITGLTLNTAIDAHLSWFLFFGTIACYNFIKYGVEAYKYIIVSNRYHKNIQFVSFIAFGCALYQSYFLKFEIWLYLIVPAALTALYALPVLPSSKRLRSWGGLKIFIVALVWAWATVILPVVDNQGLSFWDVGITSARRFLFVLIILVPFEIRDLAYDLPELKTLPQRYGVTRTKIFGAFATLAFFFLIFLKNSISMDEIIVTGILFLILGGLMFVTKRSQSRYFASFWVDTIPVLWYFLLLLLQHYFSFDSAAVVSF